MYGVNAVAVASTSLISSPCGDSKNTVGALCIWPLLLAGSYGLKDSISRTGHSKYSNVAPSALITMVLRLADGR